MKKTIEEMIAESPLYKRSVIVMKHQSTGHILKVNDTAEDRLEFAKLGYESVTGIPEDPNNREKIEIKDDSSDDQGEPERPGSKKGRK